MSEQSGSLDPMRSLLEFLATLKAGSVPAETVGELETLLAECWPLLAGGGDHGMTGEKLRGRMEKVRWESPEITFEIERHGGTVMGSSRAEVHQYAVDVRAGVARSGAGRTRQLTPMQPRLDVKALVAEIVELVAAGKYDSRLRWMPDRHVEVLVGRILPSGSAVKQTLAGRRKRFGMLLAEQMGRHGWAKLQGSRHIFLRTG